MRKDFDDLPRPQTDKCSLFATGRRSLQYLHTLRTRWDTGLPGAKVLCAGPFTPFAEKGISVVVYVLGLCVVIDLTAIPTHLFVAAAVDHHTRLPGPSRLKGPLPRCGGALHRLVRAAVPVPRPACGAGSAWGAPGRPGSGLGGGAVHDDDGALCTAGRHAARLPAVVGRRGARGRAGVRGGAGGVGRRGAGLRRSGGGRGGAPVTYCGCNEFCGFCKSPNHNTL